MSALPEAKKEILPPRGREQRQHSKRKPLPFVTSAVFFTAGLVTLIIWASYMFFQQVSTRTAVQHFCCPEVLDDLDAYVNRDVDPCHSLYDFVCGRRPQGSLTTFDMISHGIRNGVAAEVHKGVTLREGDAVKALVIFQRSCIRPMLDPMEATSQAHAFFHSLNRTWNVFSPEPTTAQLSTLISAMTVSYKVDTIVSVNIMPSWSKKPLDTVELIVGLGTALNRTLPKIVMRTVLKWVTTFLSSTDDLVTLKDVQEFEAGLRRLKKRYTNAFASSVSEISSHWPGMAALALTEIFTKTLPSHVLFSDITRLYLRDAESLRDVLQYTFDPTRIKAALPFLLSHAMTVPMSSYWSFRSSSRGGQDAFKACETLSGMNGAELWGLAACGLYDVPQAREHVSAMLAEVRKAASESLRLSSTTDEGNRNTAISKINNMNVYFPEEFAHPEVKVPTMGDNLFVNVFLMNKHRRAVSIKTSPSGMHYGGERALYQRRFQYNFKENSLYASLTGLQRPLFYPTADKDINLATVGTHIAQILYLSIGYRGGLIDSTGKPRAWWTPATQTAMDDLKACLLMQETNMTNTSTAMYEHYDDVLALMRGLNAVVEVIGNTLSGFPPVDPYGWNMTRAQLFFMRFCLTTCNLYPGQGDAVCDVVARRVRLYEQEFQCRLGDKMSYDSRCPLKI